MPRIARTSASGKIVRIPGVDKHRITLLCIGIFFLTFPSEAGFCPGSHRDLYPCSVFLLVCHLSVGFVLLSWYTFLSVGRLRSPAGHLQALSKVHFVSEKASFLIRVLSLHWLFLPSCVTRGLNKKIPDCNFSPLPSLVLHTSATLPWLRISRNYLNFCSHSGRSITCIVKFLLLFIITFRELIVLPV